MNNLFDPMYEMDEDGEMILVKEPQPLYDPELDEAKYDVDGHYLLSHKYYPQWLSNPNTKEPATD